MTLLIQNIIRLWLRGKASRQAYERLSVSMRLSVWRGFIRGANPKKSYRYRVELIRSHIGYVPSSCVVP
jgi:hypothetical protein